VANFQDLVAKLTLDQKVAVLSGRDFWHTVALEDIGLESIRLSDGPSGVRGESFDERNPSLSLPSASALSATWDIELAKRYGEVAASEAIDKGVQVVLGPTINLHRSPLGGRHFESYSEDPILTGEIASAFVKGAQSKNIGACPKHYVANDSETDRFTVDAIIDEQTLHELYLRPFQIAVSQAQPWMLMSSYNAVNGHSMSESPLLEDPLKTQWGFDGVVVSDWTAVRTVEAAATGQDLAMPGPYTPWNEGLKEAVLAGKIPESALDQKIERILLLASRVGKLGNSVSYDPLPTAERRIAAEEISQAAMVLLKNNGVLPLAAGVSVALSGDSAARPRIQGGGSATVIPDQVTSPLQALIEKLSANRVSYAVGAELLSDCATYTDEQMTNPVTKSPGAHVKFFSKAGELLRTEDRLSSFFIWEVHQAAGAYRIEVEFDLDLASVTTADYAIGAATVNPFQIFVDGDVVVGRSVGAEYDDIATAILQPPVLGAKFDLKGRTRVNVKVVLTEAGIAETHGMASLMIGEVARNDDPSKLIQQAVANAEKADVAVVVVGTNSAVEAEGFDRSNIKLPGHQDELVWAVSKANPNTVVIVNSGSPVDMPWRNDVAAILVSWFGGQGMGPALASVLTGDAEPAGRLPTSWVMSDEGEPLSTAATSGKLHYTEGINIGYRSLSTPVDFPIGSGVGYGQWQITSATATKQPDALLLSVELENLAATLSKGCALVFASKPDSSFPRPKSWLIGFARTEPVVGKTTAEINIPLDYLATYQSGWQLESGSYQLEVVTQFGAAGAKLEIVI
jgi:beta-glucosidase